jgi:hypothetical protein
MGVVVATELLVGHAIGMTDQHPDQSSEPSAETQGAKSLTAFGEPLWLDVLKTLGVGLALLSVTVVVGGLLGVAIMAPWGRASPDCSIYCVLEKQIDGFFSDKPS